MDSFRDFDAARAERKNVAPTFSLGGQTFRCVAQPTAAATLDLIAATNISVAYRGWVFSCLRDDDEDRTVRGSVVMTTGGSSLERFEELLERRTDPVTLEDVIAVGDWLAEFYAGRPTVPSSESSDGRRPNGQPSSPPSLVREWIPSP